MSFLGNDDKTIFFLDDDTLCTQHFCSTHLLKVLREMRHMRSQSRLQGYLLSPDSSEDVTGVCVDVSPEFPLRKKHGVHFVLVSVPPDGVSISTPPRALEVSLFGETGDAPLHPLAGQDNTKTLYSVSELVSFLDKLANFH